MNKLLMILSITIALYAPASYAALEKSNVTHKTDNSLPPNQNTPGQSCIPLQDTVLLPKTPTPLDLLHSPNRAHSQPHTNTSTQNHNQLIIDTRAIQQTGAINTESTSTNNISPPIHTLPAELLQLVLTELQSDPIALLQASRTCRSWHATVTDITKQTTLTLLRENNNDPEHALIPAIHNNLVLCVTSLIRDYSVNPNTLYFMQFKSDNINAHKTECLNALIVHDMTPLIHAVIIKNMKKKSDLFTIQALLLYRADPNKVEQSGNCSLHYAAHYDDMASVCTLLNHDANANILNLAGKTARDLSRCPLVRSTLNAHASLLTRMNTWDMNIVSVSIAMVLAILTHNYYIQNQTS